MKFRSVIPFAAALAFAVPALAEPGSAPVAPEGMAKHHADMCNNMYAGAVGRLASLEVRLKLTATQKPLFERWKTVRLASAKARAAKCADMAMPEGKPAIIDGLKRETAMLEARLADLKAETPALEALVNALDQDQQDILRREAVHAMHHRFEMGERFMAHHEPMGHESTGSMGHHRDAPPTP